MGEGQRLPWKSSQGRTLFRGRSTMVVFREGLILGDLPTILVTKSHKAPLMLILARASFIQCFHPFHAIVICLATNQEPSQVCQGIGYNSTEANDWCGVEIHGTVVQNMRQMADEKGDEFNFNSFSSHFKTSVVSLFIEENEVSNSQKTGEHQKTLETRDSGNPPKKIKFTWNQCPKEQHSGGFLMTKSGGFFSHNILGLSSMTKSVFFLDFSATLWKTQFICQSLIRSVSRRDTSAAVWSVLRTVVGFCGPSRVCWEDVLWVIPTSKDGKIWEKWWKKKTCIRRNVEGQIGKWSLQKKLFLKKHEIL